MVIQIHHTPTKTYVFYERPQLEYFDRYYAGLESPHFLPPTTIRRHVVFILEVRADGLEIFSAYWRFI